MKKIGSILLLLIINITSYLGASPFSKIIITSKEAECSPVSGKKDYYRFIYRGNVSVVLADESKITAQEMVVLIHQGKQAHTSPAVAVKKQKMVLPSAIKKISLEGGVCLDSEYDRVKARRAEVLSSENLCILRDNVSVVHKKQKRNDVPVTLSGSTARFNFVTKKLMFAGNKSKPVTTVIDLADMKKPAIKSTQKKKS